MRYDIGDVLDLTLNDQAPMPFRGEVVVHGLTTGEIIEGLRPPFWFMNQCMDLYREGKEKFFYVARCEGAFSGYQTTGLKGGNLILLPESFIDMQQTRRSYSEFGIISTGRPLD